jgi:hypothetical protein
MGVGRFNMGRSEGVTEYLFALIEYSISGLGGSV